MYFYSGFRIININLICFRLLNHTMSKRTKQRHSYSFLFLKNLEQLLSTFRSRTYKVFKEYLIFKYFSKYTKITVITSHYHFPHKCHLHTSMFLYNITQYGVMHMNSLYTPVKKTIHPKFIKIDTIGRIVTYNYTY